MTPERRRELKERVKDLFRCESFGYSVASSDVMQLLLEVEREVWERAAKVNLDLLREHVPGAPGISVLLVAANRCRQQAEEAR